MMEIDLFSYNIYYDEFSYVIRFDKKFVEIVKKEDSMEINKMSDVNKSIHLHNLRYVKKLEEESGIIIDYICKDLHTDFVMKCRLFYIVCVNDHKLAMFVINQNSDKDDCKIQKLSDKAILKELDNKYNEQSVYINMKYYLQKRKLSKVKLKQNVQRKTTLML
jgi:hypothetical protein